MATAVRHDAHARPTGPADGAADPAGDHGSAASAVPLTGEAGQDAEQVVTRIHPGAGNSGSGEGASGAPVDFSPPDVRPSEALMRLAYRLGVPGSMMSMGGHSRLRLMATVSNAVRGNRMSGTALRAGHFLVHGAKTGIEHVDFAGGTASGLPLERTVHSFSWLCDLEASGAREQVAPVAERILAAWLMHNQQVPAGTIGSAGRGAAWTVGNAANRLLNWLVHAPLILSGDKALRSRALAAIAATARWLDRNVDKAEDALDRTTAWCAIVAAGLLLPEGKPRRLFGEAGLVRALGELVSDDGGVLSRSPVAQVEALALLVRLRCCYNATRRQPVEPVEQVIAMMVPPLLTVLYADGSSGAWQGSWAIDAEDLAALIGATGVRARPAREIGHWGYQRAEAARGLLVLDAAPPPEKRHARHGCASTLAFEFAHGSHRLIVNCGGAASAGGTIPARLEQGLRGTAAHSTLSLDDTNSSAVLLKGAIGQGVGEVRFDRSRIIPEDGPGATRLVASHDGYVARFGLVHERELLLADDGGQLIGEDRLLPAGRKGRRGKVAYAIRFHLGRDVLATPEDDGSGVILTLPDGETWCFAPESGSVEIEDSVWVDSMGRMQPTSQIVMQGLVSRGGGAFAWHLSRLD